jgi:Na(+)-translocating NADH:ubiquinone oxidoreductase B subunit
MRPLLNILDRLRPHFQQGGRFNLLKPVFDAADALFFSPLETTEFAPHVRDPLDVKRVMTLVIVALLPCIVASVYFFGLRMLAMILVSYVAGGLVEVGFAIVRKEGINEGFFVTGMLFPLILPPGLPLWMVGLGCAFGVLIGKELFGGTGRNLFNPALVGRIFLALAYPRPMSGSWIEPGTGVLGRLTQYSVDAVSTATPLVAAKSGHLIDLPSLFFGGITGSAGETSALAVILGGLFLLFVGVASWRTVVSVLGTFAVMTAFLHGGQGDVVVWHLLAGGLLFGTFFMATDPVTSPMSNGGKWAYGVIIGVSTVLIRNLTGYVEGVMFAILLGNIFAPILDELFVSVELRKLRGYKT